MMGSRGTTNGDECDAFSHRSRRILHWRQGELRKIKRGFWKRARKAGDAEGRGQAAEALR